MSSKTYHNYEEPIGIMRKLTSLGQPFSITFIKLDGTVTRIDKAALRPMSIKGRNAQYRIQYTNLNTKEHRSFYLPLLLAVEDIKIKL